MAKNPTAEEAIERARALQERKIDAVRVLADASQNVSITRERAGAAERDYAQVFGNAITAGWTPEELRKIGFVETERKVRGRRASTSLTRSKPAPDVNEDGQAGEAG